MKDPLSNFTSRSVFFIAITEFGMALAFNFVMAFMPFYILKISPYGQKETILWTGAIMGTSAVFAALTSTFWGGMTARFSPKLLFLRAIIGHGIVYLLMGFTENLYLLMALRIAQGCLGGVSTIALILLSHLSSRESLPRDMSLFQNSITAGHLIGPPVGAYLATAIGYRAPFVFAGALIAVVTWFCWRNVPDVPLQKKAARSAGRKRGGIFSGWALCMAAVFNLTFLPSILPQVLQEFDWVGKDAVNMAGFIMMAYSVAAIAGNFLISTFATRVGLRRAIAAACLGGAFCQALLSIVPGVWSFTLVRMAQVFFIAAILPMTISVFARSAGGGEIGFLNSARFAGNAMGPLLATSILAYSNLLILYLGIAGTTVALFLVFLRVVRPSDGPA
ncbi:MAG: drug efflux system protein MdtG [Syntrophaceae bacterium PtaU1.Bin231]|nr:MAG: drug efflux system protein MdtG [Syntrophaceae bacterium PtaU1.Bin231]HOG16324.1 MFS transporter [Syntrophales bacterium]